ncbi:MAG: ATP synthase F1 subunit gamma [Candidatus Andersenbacteria bacterium]
MAASKSPREIRRRIRSVTSTQKITKALETVSAVKMRKAQQAVLAGRPFAEEALALLRRLGTLSNLGAHPLLARKQTGRQLLVLIAPDKGLTGGLGTNLFRRVTDLVAEQSSGKGRTTDVRAVGREAAKFAERSGYTVVGTSRNDVVDVTSARALRDELVEAYVNGPYDKVILGYTQFVSTLKQQPFVRGILPVTIEKIVDVEELPPALTEPASLTPDVYDLEPTPQELLDELVPELVTMLIYHALQESAASEHSARMVAMKNAFDNATDLIGELTQTFNRLRQESITSALAEISAGVAALERA